MSYMQFFVILRYCTQPVNKLQQVRVWKEQARAELFMGEVELPDQSRPAPGGEPCLVWMNAFDTTSQSTAKKGLAWLLPPSTLFTMVVTSDPQ